MTSARMQFMASRLLQKSRRVALAVIPSFALLLIAGCSRDLHSTESALDPATPQAHQITSLMWMFIWVCVAVYVLVMIVLLGAFIRRRHGAAMVPNNDPLIHPDPHHERRVWTAVSSAIIVTVITLFVLLFSDFAAGRALHKITETPDPLHIKIIGHQWWWEVHYVDWPERFGRHVASNSVATANEIHVPVDPQHPIAIECELDSHDVIHSFWVPNLQGKKDLVPGHTTDLWFQADVPGTYWGECAEYCGYQHAQMRLVVVAEPADEFKSWLEAQRKEAPAPTNDVQHRGQNVFLHAACAMCHTIQGTDARGNLGPDFTHVASRMVLAGGAVPNVKGHLAGWIIDPQSIKPGARMPQNNLSPGDLRTLLEYMETLK